jgi:putative ABC transport system permease protein
VIRIYRWLLRLYPAQFRDRYRAELEEAFSAERLNERYSGLAGSTRFCTYILHDLVTSALRSRVAQVRSSHFPQLPAQHKRTQMDALIQDLRYTIRSLLRRPGFTAVAVLSLAIGIGANSLIYGLVDGYVLHPFPYPDPDRLVAIGVGFPKLSSDVGYVEVLSPAEYSDIRTARGFSKFAAFDLGNRNISGGDVPERVFTALLLDDLFPVVGLAPALGRGFTSEELSPNGPNVAVISHRLWQTRFGADPAIINRSIRIGGESATVIGVMPPGLLLLGTDLWLPWGADTSQMPRNRRQFTVLARVAPGMDLDSVNTELRTIAARVAQNEASRFKEYDGWYLTATPWAAALLRDLRPAAFLLVGAVALVLLIACVNLANLLLARSTSRARELALRLALGAGRARVVRHLLTESLLLAIAGGSLGVAIAYGGVQVAEFVLPPQLALLDLHAGINMRVLLWSIAVTFVAGILVGAIPAVQASRADPHESLKADARGTPSRAATRARAALVVVEIALAVVLLLGATLLTRSILNVYAVDQGYDPRGVLTLRLTLPRERYPAEATTLFFERLVERVSALPGVRSVAASSQYPPMGAFDTQFMVERPNTSASETIPMALITVATPSLFEALGVPMRSGRTFSIEDRLTSPPVVVVNRTLANRYLPGVEPIGQRIRLGSNPSNRSATVVGVVDDFKNSGPTQPVRPEIYMPVRQQTEWNQLFLLVRASQPPAAILPSVRAVVRSLDPEQPVYGIRSLEEALAQSVFQQRAAAGLLTTFAFAALLMAAVGIFGVLSYAVSARTQEFGIRLAIGAQRRDVVWLIIGHVLRLTAGGIAIGIFLLLAGWRAIAGLLFGVEPTDSLTMAAVTMVLVSVALIAAWIPAVRACRIDPIEALRYE